MACVVLFCVVWSSNFSLLENTKHIHYSIFRERGGEGEQERDVREGRREILRGDQGEGKERESKHQLFCLECSVNCLDYTFVKDLFHNIWLSHHHLHSRLLKSNEKFRTVEDQNYTNIFLFYINPQSCFEIICVYRREFWCLTLHSVVWYISCMLFS